MFSSEQFYLLIIIAETSAALVYISHKIFAEGPILDPKSFLSTMGRDLEKKWENLKKFT